MSWARDTSGVVNTTKKIARMVDADDIKEQKRMAKPETIKDIIEETMRVSGVSYKVPVRDKQFGGDHYKRMGIEPWDVVDTWPLEQRIGYYRGGALKYTMRMGNKDEQLQEAQKGLHYQEKLVDTLKKAQDENG
jgi:hypothetical protein